MRERALAARDRLLAEPRFRRWAAAFPLTRPIARRRARELFDLCAGFVYSQVLLACVELKLFECLARGPLRLEQLGARLGLRAEAAERLLRAATSLRLVEPRGAQRYGLGPLGAALAGEPAIMALVEHHRLLYADLRDPVALLRAPRGGGELARFWPYAGAAAGRDPGVEEVRAYSDLMAVSQSLIAAEVLDAYPLDGHRCLLDVGGGNGAFLLQAAARAPQLQLRLFDLPAVAASARARFAQAGIADRAQAFGGDFLRDPLPPGADLASLVRVVHDHDDASALRVLRGVRRALLPGGRLLLAEPMSGVRGALPVGDAYFGFYLLAMGSGQPRTAARLTALLRAAGFVAVREVSTRIPLQTGLLVATAPGETSVNKN
jgi:demethylspheroidene O-methyltransferase